MNESRQPACAKTRVVVFLCEQRTERGLQDSMNCLMNREDERHETFDRNKVARKGRSGR